MESRKAIHKCFGAKSAGPKYKCLLMSFAIFGIGNRPGKWKSETTRQVDRAKQKDVPHGGIGRKRLLSWKITPCLFWMATPVSYRCFPINTCSDTSPYHQYLLVKWVNIPFVWGFFRQGYKMPETIHPNQDAHPTGNWHLSMARQNSDSAMTRTGLDPFTSHWIRRSSCCPTSGHCTGIKPWAARVGRPWSGCTSTAQGAPSTATAGPNQLGTEGGRNRVKNSTNHQKRLEERFMASSEEQFLGWLVEVMVWGWCHEARHLVCTGHEFMSFKLMDSEWMWFQGCAILVASANKTSKLGNR